MTLATPLSRIISTIRNHFWVAFLLTSLSLQAQQFNYSAQTNTTTWQELTNQNLCNTVNVAWETSYRIPVGFSFPFNGGQYDSVTIETNGYLVFDHYRNQAFTAYNSFRDKLDTAGNHSVLSYQLTGTTGNHLLKIQYKNVGQSDLPHEFLSYQIWLYENGRIDLITGTNSYQPDPNDSLSVADTTHYVRTGLLNMNMTGEVRGFFVGTIPSGSGGMPLNDDHPAPVYFNAIPTAGTRFVFTPALN